MSRRDGRHVRGDYRTPIANDGQGIGSRDRCIKRRPLATLMNKTDLTSVSANLLYHRGRRGGEEPTHSSTSASIGQGHALL